MLPVYRCSRGSTSLVSSTPFKYHPLNISQDCEFPSYILDGIFLYFLSATAITLTSIDVQLDGRYMYMEMYILVYGTSKATFLAWYHGMLNQLPDGMKCRSPPPIAAVTQFAGGSFSSQVCYTYNVHVHSGRSFFVTFSNNYCVVPPNITTVHLDHNGSVYDGRCDVGVTWANGVDQCRQNGVLGTSQPLRQSCTHKLRMLNLLQFTSVNKSIGSCSSPKIYLHALNIHFIVYFHPMVMA